MATYRVSSYYNHHRNRFSNFARMAGSMEVGEEGRANILDTSHRNAKTDNACLCDCSMSTLIDHQTTLKYLAYLGFDGDTRTALKVTRPKKADRKKGKIQRGVFLCYVFGAPGTGKV